MTVNLEKLRAVAYVDVVHETETIRAFGRPDDEVLIGWKATAWFFSLNATASAGSRLDAEVAAIKALSDVLISLSDAIAGVSE